MPLKSLRRTTARAAGAFVLATLSPLLASCAYEEATDRPYTPAAGTNEQEGGIDVLNAVIVSAEDGSGTFIASLANNDPEESATWDGLESPEPGALTAQGFSSFRLDPGGFANLADVGGVEVTGDFVIGDFVPVVLQFGDGDQIEMDVPVVTNCGEFEGLDGPVDEEACEPAHSPVEH